MTAQHTPGPWHVGIDDEGVDGFPYIEVNAGKEMHDSFCSIAYVQGEWDGNEAPLGNVSHANARLIAAAPDMLAALVALEGSFEKHRPKELWDAARAAIAKATGQ